MLRATRKYWKPYGWLIIALLAGAAIDHSFFYPIQKDQEIKQSKQQPSDESIEVSSDQAVARYTEYLVLFTAVLAAVGIAQGIFTAQQIKLSRDEFNASIKRPWIFISGVSSLKEGRVEDEIWTRADYSIVNHGEAPAIIEAVQCQFIYTEGYEDEPLNVERDHDLIVNPIVGPAESRLNIPQIVPAGLLSEDRITYVVGNTRGFFVPQLRRNEDFIFVVKIQYRGISSAGHESAALWRWNYATSMFETSGGEQHNYAK